MRTFEVWSPNQVAADRDRPLGQLRPHLERLATQQGAWPPRVPEHVARFEPAHPTTRHHDTVEDALESGAAAVDRFVDAGADLVVVAGGGPRTTALVLLAALLERDPVSVLGTTGSPGWAEQVVAVRNGLRAARPHLHEPRALLAAVGAVEVAELTGVLLQCGVRRTPVLISGAPDVLAAALVARRVAFSVDGWLLAGCTPATGAAALALTDLRVAPVLDLELDDPRAVELALALLLGAVPLAG